MPFTKTYDNPTNIPYDCIKKYSRSKAQAKFQKHEWAFTLETWYTMWEESGVKEHRGNKPYQYVMVRKDEIEAWGPHNCIVVSRRKHLIKGCLENIHKSIPKRDWEDRHAVRKHND